MQVADSPTVVFNREGESDVVRLPIGCTVAVTSWSVFLGAMRTAQEAAAEFDNVADLRQLEGLVEKMEREGFRPFTITELTSDAPGLMLRLCSVIDGAVQEVLTRPYADKKGLKASGGKGWYGHYFRIHNCGCQLLVSSERWSRFGLSPIWLRVMTREWKFAQEMRASLLNAVMDDSLIREEPVGDWQGFWVAIRLEEGCERDAVVQGILKQVERISKALSGYSADGSIPVAVVAPETLPEV